MSARLRKTELSSEGLPSTSTGPWKSQFTRSRCLPLFGAALSDNANDIRKAELHRSAVAIGSEGRGLSRELLDICGGELIIPMNPHSESLNAAIAASVIMWEMSR